MSYHHAPGHLAGSYHHSRTFTLPPAGSNNHSPDPLIDSSTVYQDRRGQLLPAMDNSPPIAEQEQFQPAVCNPKSKRIILIK